MQTNVLALLLIVESQLINSKLDGIFLQTDTSFSLKGDLTYETTNGEENLGVEGNYKLGMVSNMMSIVTIFVPRHFKQKYHQRSSILDYWPLVHM